jgi:hypothetical protein
MDQLPGSIILTIVALTVFLIYTTALGYAVQDSFVRTRLMMTGFFIYIVLALTISFWQYAIATLPYSIPAALAGAIVGRVVGVRAAEARLRAEGVSHYIQHFAHVHIGSLQDLAWWKLINFYTVITSLVLINCIGLSTVIFHEARPWALFTSAVGAFLLGTIAPYLIHIWSIGAKHRSSSTTSE